jgi:hypothetical protein
MGDVEIVAFIICEFMLAWNLNCGHGQFVVEGVIVFPIHVRRVGASDEVPFRLFVVFEVARRRHRHFHVLGYVDSLLLFNKLLAQEHLLLKHLLGKVFCREI